MWLGTEFPGDTNKLLKWVQHDLYWGMVVRLYTPPRDRYLDACRLIQTNTDLAIRLRSMECFDHRTLQDIHDLIAAWFRFTKDNGANSAWVKPRKYTKLVLPQNGAPSSKKKAGA
jgi:hypothetical protein